MMGWRSVGGNAPAKRGGELRFVQHSSGSYWLDSISLSCI